MINFTHLKVLLQKDFITLWRSKGFMCAFIILPIGIMAAFIAIQGLVDNGQKSGNLIYDYFRFTSTALSPFDQTFWGYSFINRTQSKVYMGSLGLPFNYTFEFNGTTYNDVYLSAYGGCTKKNKARYYYSKIGVVSSDPDLLLDLAQYFNDYVILNHYMETGDTGQNFTVDSFTNIEDAFNQVSSLDNQPYCFIVNVKQFDMVNDLYDIEFSFGGETMPNTLLPSFNDLVKSPDVASWNMWFDSGVTALYPFLTEFIARKKKGSDLSSFIPLYAQQTGYSPMKSGPFENISPIGIQQLSQFYPFFVMIIFIAPYFYIVSKMASEKESKAKEGMKMMGLNDLTYYLAWFILYLTICIVVSIIVTIMTYIGVFKQINFFLFFIFMVLYGMTLWSWAFVIIAFLPTKRSSGIAAVLINFITYYLSQILQDPATSSSLQYGMSVFPNVCMNQIVKQIFFLNYQTENGLNFENSRIEYQGYSFQNGLFILVGDVILWSIIGLYLDQVVPSQYGVAKPWNFLCKSSKKKVLEYEPLDEDETRRTSRKDVTCFEPIPDQLRRQEQNKECLKIHNLVKSFGDFTAVKGVDMTMYNGQIFALLGHNGAGKTTTLSMLTGLLEPTSGRAEVFGKDIFNEMDEIRKILGVCPQHDVLFEMLTAEEHLRLFAAFKGTEPELIENQVNNMLKDIDLEDVKYQQSKTLSGGQKRKLSVAIAMIGNSKIVLLDEPSSGMDTSARRRMWEMLKKNKNGKIVILTTHYMDEADILGDRIAIMAEGDVQCTGSSLFLKNRYGVGYNLKIAKTSRNPAPQVDQFVFLRIQNALKMQEVSSEITYQLPSDSQPLFKKFFEEFDQQMENLGVKSYGVGITTLEEVFLKIGHGQEMEQKRFERQELRAKEEENQTKGQFNNEIEGDDKQPQIFSEDQYLDNYSVVDDPQQSGLFLQQLWQLIRKKLLMQIRDKKTLGIDTIFPLILILVGLWLATIAVIKNETPRLMTPALLPQNKFYYNNNTDQTYYTKTANIVNFMTNVAALNTSLFQLGEAVQIKTTGLNENNQSYNLNITQMVVQLDDFVYSKTQETGVPSYGQIYIETLTTNPTYGYSIILLLNSTSQDAAGCYGAFAHQALLQQYFKDTKLPYNPNIQINFTNTPFPLTAQAQAVVKTAAGTTSSILMGIAWLMISDSLIQNVIRERQRNIKHQIMVSGSSLVAYWLGHYIADILFQTLPSVVAIIGVQAFGIQVDQVWILFLLLIFANPAFIYFLTFIFEKEETGSLVVKMIYFVIGIIAPIAISILQVVNSSTANYANILRWFFLPFPIFSLTFGYMSISNIDIIQLVNKLQVAPKPTDNNVAGLSIYFLCGSTVVYWILIAMFELKFFKFLLCNKSGASDEINSTMDEDQTGFNGNNDPQSRQSLIDRFSKQNQIEPEVLKEAQRLDNVDDDIPVKMVHMQKRYGKIQAVKDVSFGIENGECFALLGVSGAGKSTCFKCLTGEIYPSSGKLTIYGHDITTSKGFQNARNLIGYCPQFDALFDGLTVKEHLEIYATLKGIRSDLKAQIVQKQIKDMDLEEYENIRANQLSGGNKRKLSVSMAMIGNPPLVFLDEPSTGVDPQAKRFMWNIVSKISTLRKKSAVIITTHSMEEAEALCTKMGIMVAGEFKCFGPSTEIKDKYGTGYEIEIKVRSLTENDIGQILQNARGYIPNTLQNCKKFLQLAGNNDLVEELDEDGEGAEFFLADKEGRPIDENEFIKWQFTEIQGKKAYNFIKGQFKDCDMIEHFGNSWKIKVSRDNFSIGFVFGMMEDVKEQFNISEYSVAQTTLEQIFNNFAMGAKQIGQIRGQTSMKKRASQTYEGIGPTNV